MKTVHLAVASYMAITGVFTLYHFFHTFYQPLHSSHLSKRDGNAINLTQQTKLRIQSWNLRNGNMKGSGTPSTDLLNDNMADKGYYTDYKEVSWSMRSQELVNHILFYDSDIFTVQEALESQVNTIAKGLVGYDWVGVGRDDGKKAGEFEAVFYKKDTLSVKNWTTIWLSETPFTPSKYSGAGSKRSATIVQFESTLTATPFTLINTHLDDKSDDARRFGASLVKYRAAYEYEHNAGPVFLTGDFNSKSIGQTAGAYEIFTGATSSVDLPKNFSSQYESSVSEKFQFTDFYVAADASARLGHYSTFTGFQKVGSTDGYGRIDFQMGGHVNGTSKNGWKITRVMVPDNFPDIKYHLSDHRSVISDITVGRVQ